MGYKVVGVTACIMGVAHTYMAAEALEKACKKHPMIDFCKVETQGSVGLENVLKDKEIAEADVVILTNEIQIKNKSRFDGKLIIEVNGTQLIKKTNDILEKAISMIEENKNK